MFNKIRNLIILIIIVGLAYGAYVVFVQKKQPTGTLSNATAKSTASVGDQKALQTGQDLLVLLNNLKTIKLDTSIFGDNSEPFKRLEDYSFTIDPDTNPGRPNPFAPLGVDAVPTTDTTLSPGFGAGIDLSPFGGVAPEPAVEEPVLTVNTTPATNIQITSAKLNADLLIVNDTTTRWFEWGKSEDAMLSNSAPFAQKMPGVFGYIATGLSTKTKYFYRAVVKTDGVTTFGATLSFTTN